MKGNNADITLHESSAFLKLARPLNAFSFFIKLIIIYRNEVPYEYRECHVKIAQLTHE